MNVYRKEYRLHNADTDFYRRLRWDTMFTMFQEASIAHTEALGAGREKTLDRGFLWVIALQQVTIRRLPEYDERITVESWPGRTMHVFFPRYYRMRDESGGILVEGSALWGLMDRQSRKLIFPEEEGIEVPETVTGDEPPLPRTFKNVPAQRRVPFTVPFSYLDLNGHMKNTRYFDLVQDLLPPEQMEKAPTRIAVEYSGEAKWGEQLSVGVAKTESGWFLLGESDHRVFRMQVEYGETQTSKK